MQGDRILLRPVTVDDVDDMLAAFQQQSVYQVGWKEREREREREGEREGGREGGRERKREGGEREATAQNRGNSYNNTKAIIGQVTYSPR